MLWRVVHNLARGLQRVAVVYTRAYTISYVAGYFVAIVHCLFCARMCLKWNACGLCALGRVVRRYTMPVALGILWVQF